MIKYLVDKEDAYKYSIGTNKKIKMKCPYCGYEKNFRLIISKNEDFLVIYVGMVISIRINLCLIY